MKRPDLVLLVIGGGALAYFVLTRRQAAPQVNVSGGGAQGGGIAGLGASLGQALSMIPGIGPLLGAAAGVAGAGLEQWQALPEQDKRTVKRTGEKIHNTFVERLGKLDPVTSTLSRTGVLKNPTEERRDKRKGLIAALQIDQGQREGAESHAMAQLQWLARPDVERWWIDQEGTTHVVYVGQKAAQRLAVPAWALDPAAWAFELTSRLFGRPVQAGTGPIEGGFTTYETAGFADENPYARKQWTLSQAPEGEARLMDSIARKH